MQEQVLWGCMHHARNEKEAEVQLHNERVRHICKKGFCFYRKVCWRSALKIPLCCRHVTSFTSLQFFTPMAQEPQHTSILQISPSRQKVHGRIQHKLRRKLCKKHLPRHVYILSTRWIVQVHQAQHGFTNVRRRTLL